MKTPLEGLRILELGHFVAAPFCTRLLADLGADVIKVEPRQGDPVRQWGDMVDGHSLWWSVHGRNKRCVTLDLKSEKGRALVLRLVARCDAVVENFRPGHLDKLGLGAEVMRGVRPGLIITHISGYGQDGPYRDRAAFGVIGEAIGGLRYLTNHPPGTSDLPPVRVGVSIGDSISGIYAAFGLMAALWQRDRVGGDDQARTVDAALTESVLSLMEGVLPEYGALGKIRAPSGGGLATAAPSNAYPSRDGCWVLIGANSEPLFAKLAQVMGQPELADMPCYQGNKARVENVAALDALITQWTRTLDADELLARLGEADIPSSKAYTAADCAADPQYIARGMVRRVEDGWFGCEVLHPGIVPHVPEAPGRVRWTGPRIGAHNDEVYGGLLGLADSEIAALRAEGVI
ncbi:succinyl-CoA--D-citramalate CoA-transferase [Acidocella aquatica]|uniref:Succinyl-CoA--D-citramalate CoA-transferase n=1 Tax=Acidocella aquatica TaxID=1922313 RepID=A0ABQ6A4U6_9PROT|nr:CoA transferase [Acidocella aquatica]GLR67476.1 succinyl-CoA--D-citramalate CoA-transferase [Acidocella aquatica]